MPHAARWCRTTAYGVLVALAAAAPASAQTGGAYSAPKPSVTGVKCRTQCSGATYARSGSLVKLRGRNLEAVETVTFLGARRAGDEVSTEPERVGPNALTVRVPRGTTGGRVVVANADGAASAPSRRRLRVEVVTTRRVAGSSGPGLEVAVTGRKVFYDADRKPTLTYVVHDDAPVHVMVEVVRSADAVPVARFDQGMVAPGEERLQAWDGRVEGADVAPDGRYEFRVYAQNGNGVRASAAQSGAQPASAPPSPDSFMFLGHKFPVRGPHDFGEFAASFGGGRGHKGQDVFARCGTPLAAARGGIVKFKQYHSRAGHYVVIDGQDAEEDYVYMHLRRAALVDKGERVHTGQIIGQVGDTGRAHGCHLHFEIWSGPGWYTGGSPLDPLPLLRAWDKYS